VQRSAAAKTFGAHDGDKGMQICEAGFNVRISAQVVRRRITSKWLTYRGGNAPRCIAPESKIFWPLADGTADSSALATAAASMGL